MWSSNHKFISLQSTDSYMFWLSLSIFRKCSLTQRDLSMYQYISYLLYFFFWVIPRRLNFICRRFGTLCYIFIGGVNRKILPAYTVFCKCNRHSVPKRRYIKFRRQGITQKKEYNIQNTAKVWNQELLVFVTQTVDGMLTSLCLEFLNVKSGGT